MAKKKKASQGKIKYMILSLIIAITAWVVITYSTNPDMTRKITGVKIELQGEEALQEKGLVLLDETDLPKMTVRVRGKRSDIMSIMDDMRVILDLGSIEKAGNYRIEGSVKLTNTRVSVESIISNGVDVTIDKFETRDFPVWIFQDGEVPDKLVKSTSVAETVSVSGATRELDMVEGVYATVYLDDKTKEGEITVEPDLVPKEDADEENFETVVIHSKSIRVMNEFYIPVEATVVPDSDSVPQYEVDKNNSTITPQTVTVGVKENNGQTIKVRAILTEYTTGETEAYIKADESIYVPESSQKVRIAPIWMPQFN